MNIKLHIKLIRNIQEKQEKQTEIQQQNETEKKTPHPIFKESTSERYRSYTTTPYFQNLEFVSFSNCLFT